MALQQGPITRFPGFTSLRAHRSFPPSAVQIGVSQGTDTSTSKPDVDVDATTLPTRGSRIRFTQAKITNFFRLQQNHTSESATSTMPNSF